MAGLLVILPLLAAGHGPVVHFFYSPDCGHCQELLIGLIPDLQSRYGFTLKKYDLAVMANYRHLEEMEAGRPAPSDDLPVVFVGDSAFYGPTAVEMRLEPLLKALRPRAIQDTVPVRPDTTTRLTLQDTVHLYHFTQVECPECGRVEAMIRAFEERLMLLQVHRMDILADTVKAFYEVLAESLGVPEERRLLVPAVFVGDDWLIRDFTSRDLEQLLQRYATGSPRLEKMGSQSGGVGIAQRFGRFSLFGIMAAGLLDGVNPCAFATIVFFVSYLAFMGRRRRDIALMAVAFIIAVFASYLAIGLGAYGLLRWFAGFKPAARAIYYVFGAASLVLGALSLYDFLVVRSGSTRKMILQLPLAVKQRIHDRIRENTRVPGIVAGSLIAGFLVSFLEFGCTGQVYLPTITFMVSSGTAGFKPVAALLAYNLMFVIPLAAIALLAVLVTGRNVGAVLERRIPLVKFLTALLFFALGAALLVAAGQ